MKENQYKHLLHQIQPIAVEQPGPQEQSYEINSQGQIYNPQEFSLQQQQQRPQYNCQNQQDSPVVVPIGATLQNEQIHSMINTTKRITNQNSFMWTIVSIYILQYFFTIGLLFIYSRFDTKDSIFLQDNSIAPLFWLILFLTISIPISVCNIGALQKNPTAAIVAIVYLFVYTTFQISLISIGFSQEIKKEGDHIYLGDYFVFGLIGAGMTCFNILGLIQLIILSIVIRINGDNFTLRQFQKTGVILSIMAGMVFVYMNLSFAVFVVSVGIIFILWFSFALARVSDENFGLTEDQAVFGSLAVFIVMMCPCFKRICRS